MLRHSINTSFVRALVGVGIVGLASCATSSASTPPAATPRTQPPPVQRQPFKGGAIDPEATNFPYPYPVSFYEFRSQGQTLQMAYLDVPPVEGTSPEALAGAQPSAAAAAPIPAGPGAEPAPVQGPEAADTAAGAQPAPGPSGGAGAGAAVGTGTAADAQVTASSAAALSRTADPGAPPAGQANSAPAGSNAAQATSEAEGNGRCVLLLHGKNFSAAAWGSTIDLLTKQGFRVIAPDQVGFGKSSKPGTYQFTFAQLAHNTRALLDSLKLQRCSVVGHSMGGMLATRFALQYPAATERLVLVNPIGLEDYAMFVPYRTVDEWYADELKQTPETIREYQRTAYYDGHWKPEYNAPMQLTAGFTLHPDYAKVAWANALTYDMIFTQPVVDEFPRVRVPTRLIIGTRDRTALGRKFAMPQTAATMGDYTQLGKRARDSIPNSQLIELPGVGHVPQVEAFDAYSDALLTALR